jgi:hypothetical protein
MPQERMNLRNILNTILLLLNTQGGFVSLSRDNVINNIVARSFRIVSSKPWPYSFIYL